MSSPEAPYQPLEDRLGHTFANPSLLVQALTHRSYIHEHPEAGTGTNERLEFLGDAIFQFLVAHALYRHYPEAPEGRLTTIRAALVSTQSFAAIGETLQLARFLRVSKGEATLEGRGRRSILAGALEAIVAAVFLDAGMEAAAGLVHRLIDPRIESAAGSTKQLNAKGQLQEVVQAAQGITPTYRVVAQSGPVHAGHFHVEVVAGNTVLGRGDGLGKRRAEVSAARDALSRWPSHTPQAGVPEGGPQDAPTLEDAASSGSTGEAGTCA